MLQKAFLILFARKIISAFEPRNLRGIYLIDFQFRLFQNFFPFAGVMFNPNYALENLKGRLT